MFKKLAFCLALSAAAWAGPAWADDALSLRADLITRGYTVQETPQEGELLVFVGADVVLVTETDGGVAYSAYFPGATADVVDAGAVADFNAAAKVGQASFDEEGYLVLRHVRDGEASHDDVVADLEAFGHALGRLSLAAGGR